MKTRLSFCTILILTLLSLCSCSAPDETVVVSPFITAQADENGNIVIDTAGIAETASYVNYSSGGSIVQLILVRGSDGEIRISFNTCQACTPSPLAYFIQDGNQFICQNCLNAFSADQLGLINGGCNPLPVEQVTITDETITIPTSYFDQFSSNFAIWRGPTA